MKSPVLVAQSPNKPNIRYSVVHKPETMEEVFAPMVEELRKKRGTMERTIVFGQTYDECTSLYLFFRYRLSSELSEPPGLQQFAKYRLVDMFTACTHPSVKNTILERFKDPKSSLRIVIATIAFGMGLDCSDIRRVIHWGVPSDVESYIQETGRVGRDGREASAVLYYGGRDMMGTRVEDPMREYCYMKEGCRRKHLMKDFDDDTEAVNISGCQCCDLCAANCCCASCISV